MNYDENLLDSNFSILDELEETHLKKEDSISSHDEKNYDENLLDPNFSILDELEETHLKKEDSISSHDEKNYDENLLDPNFSILDALDITHLKKEDSISSHDEKNYDENLLDPNFSILDKLDNDEILLKSTNFLILDELKGIHLKKKNNIPNKFKFQNEEHKDFIESNLSNHKKTKNSLWKFSNQKEISKEIIHQEKSQPSIQITSSKKTSIIPGEITMKPIIKKKIFLKKGEGKNVGTIQKKPLK